MPLVESGRIVEDQFVRIADDAPVPDGVAVIVSGARFLADAEALTQRVEAVGVVWPNNRPIAELAPYLTRIALVVIPAERPRSIALIVRFGHTRPPGIRLIFMTGHWLREPSGHGWPSRSCFCSRESGSW